MVTGFEAHPLLVVAEVRRAGSIAAAARSLGYSEATLAHHLRALHHDVGTPVTQRQGRTVALTPLGEALADRGDEIRRQLEAARADAEAHGGLVRGTLDLVAIPSFVAGRLPGVLATFRGRHPGVTVRLQAMEPPAARARLRAGTTDLAIVFEPDGADPDVDNRWTRVALGRDPLHAVLPTTHPRAGDETVELAALAEEDWIAGCADCRQQLLGMAARAGFEPSIVFETDDHLAVQQLVAHDLGVAILPQLALDAGGSNAAVSTPSVAPTAGRTITALGPGTLPSPARALLALLANGT